MAQINSEYDVGAAFERIEDELIASMIRNMDRHRAEETEEGIRWSMWQAEQLKALERYKRKNQEKYSKQFRHINSQITDLIRTAKQKGNMQQEIRILQAIKKGWKVNGKNRSPAHNSMTSEFFKLNERKLDAMIKATTYDMQKAETAILRMANDQYRRIIFNAQIYANSGAGTYEKAVDMATRDFISAGLNCVEYSNGARHTLADYADMAIRTASKRAYLQGEGEKRAEWGIHTVIMNKRGNPCPKCLPFVGKVLIDDVWSGGKASDGPYPLMSSAIAAGLYHPRCKDSHTTYFPGISSPPDQKYSKTELGEIEQASQEEAKQQYVERQEKKYGRLAEFSLDPENQQRYEQKQKEWQQVRTHTGNINSQENFGVKSMEKGQGFEDVTAEWMKTATPNSHNVEEIYKYKMGDAIYSVDGKNVLLDYSEKERQVAELLKKELGGEISMVPRVLKPQRISTPDYIFRNQAFDLKELSGASEHVIYNAIAKKKRQASNFILDISKSPLDEREITKQIGEIYWSKHTAFVQEIIVIKDEKIKKIYKRNREK